MQIVAYREGREGPGLKKIEEEKMRIFTSLELEPKDDNELAGLFRKVGSKPTKGRTVD